MEWISVNDYRPGIKPIRCLYRFSDGSDGVYVSNRYPITGTYLSEDGKSEKYVTHWFEIIDPTPSSHNSN